MSKKFIFLQKGESGVSLIFALLILAGILATSLGVAVLMLKEIKISTNIGNSVPAYYAAEAGIEKILYDVRYNGVEPYNIGETSLGIGSTFEVKIVDVGPPCRIKSVGSYEGIKRGVEIEY
jgi:hypothetical protein